MKKKILISVVCILSICVFALTLSACSAASFGVEKSVDSVGGALGAQALEYTRQITQEFPDRTSGEGKDLDFVKWISEFMTSDGWSTAGYTDVEGYGAVRKFVFDGVGGQKNGYNAVFTKKTSGESKGTLLFTAAYDNCYSVSTSDSAGNLLMQYKSDGAYQSTTSVAALMTLSSQLAAATDLNYDVTVAFLGAGSFAWAGAVQLFYDLSGEERNNIALMVNYSRLGGGDNLYMYTRDKATGYGDYFYEVADVNSLGFTPVPADKHIVSGYVYEDSKLDYFHVGMLGNQLYFMNNDIPTLAYMAFNWSDLSLPSVVERKGYDNVYETSADTFDNMVTRAGGEAAVEAQLDAVLTSTLTALASQNAAMLDKALASARADEVDAVSQNSLWALFLGVILDIVLACGMLALAFRARKFVVNNKDKMVKPPSGGDGGSDGDENVFEEDNTSGGGPAKGGGGGDDVFEGF